MAGLDWLLSSLSPSSDYYLKEGRKQVEHTIACLLTDSFFFVVGIDTCDLPCQLCPLNR